jgi:hypothetical protein
MKCPFDLKNKNQIITFEEIDPYNPQNKLKGYINRREGQLYGSLWITHVNGKRCPQLIYSAPKQHYPFDKDNNWKFPEYDIVKLYEKLDGTCVVSYNYRDKKGNFYLTYKTRLRPFLGAGKFGNFFALWNEMREKYPDIDKLCGDKPYYFMFELYGKRNKILIDYDVPLDTKLIFVRDSFGNVFPPHIATFGFNGLIPILQEDAVTKEITEDGYITVQNALETNLQIDEENHIMKGKEGYVMYFIKDGWAVQIKCKPPSVLKYHWSEDSIPYESIYTTVYNAYENFDEPSFDDVVGLLKEEYDDSKIEKSRVRIEKILGKVLFDKKFQYTLAEDYKKMKFDINRDKVTCMRWFGQNYPKSEAKRIYNLLKQYEEK